MTPHLHDIRRDDELLDALGSRRPVGDDHDALSALLSQWTGEIDDVEARATVAPGRYARNTRRRMGRVALASGAALTALSISSVAAAVSGTSVPVFRELGGVTRGLVGAEPLPEQVRATGVIQDRADPSVPGTNRTNTVGVPATTSTSAPSGPTGQSASSVESSPSASTTWVRTSTGWVQRTSSTRPTPSSSSTTDGRTRTRPATQPTRATSTTSPAPTSTAGPTSTTTAAAPSSSPTTTKSKTQTVRPSSTPEPTTAVSPTTTSTSTPHKGVAPTTTQPESTAGPTKRAKPTLPRPSRTKASNVLEGGQGQRQDTLIGRSGASS